MPLTLLGMVKEIEVMYITLLHVYLPLLPKANTDVNIVRFERVQIEEVICNPRKKVMHQGKALIDQGFALMHHLW